MAYNQKQGDYPYLTLPDKLELSKPFPYFFYEQSNGDYPCLTKIPNLIGISQPTPFILYSQNISINNGYPYFNHLPKMLGVPIREEASGMYEFEIVLSDEIQTIEIDDISYTNLGGLKKHKDNINSEITKLNDTISTIPITKTIDEYAEEYNSITNGNIDYKKRDWFVTDKQMWERQWVDFPRGEKTSVYKQRFTFKNSSGEDHYVIDISPIISQDSIYTPLQLNIYSEVLRIVCENDGTIEDILEEDFKNLIVHIYDGIPEFDDNEKTEIDRQLDTIESEHMTLVELQYNKDILEQTSSQIESLENGKYAENNYTLIIEEEW